MCQVTDRKMKLVTVEHKKQSQGVILYHCEHRLVQNKPKSGLLLKFCLETAGKICGLHGDSHHSNALQFMREQTHQKKRGENLPRQKSVGCFMPQKI